MSKAVARFILVALFLLPFTFVLGQDAKLSGAKIKLDPSTKMELISSQVKMAEYRGRTALHLVPLPGREQGDEGIMAVITDTDFQNGVIEVDVAGAPRQGAAPNMKGFIGVSFRIHDDKAETFYIRPVNARLDDQLFRNHTAQYVSEPGFGWQRLRQESPGVYESYVDVETGAWTKLKIEVEGAKARLYVNGAAQPCLVVNDLKQGEGRGKIALWTHATTEAYFSNLTVKVKP